MHPADVTCLPRPAAVPFQTATVLLLWLLCTNIVSCSSKDCLDVVGVAGMGISWWVHRWKSKPIQLFETARQQAAEGHLHLESAAVLKSIYRCAYSGLCSCLWSAHLICLSVHRTPNPESQPHQRVEIKYACHYGACLSHRPPHHHSYHCAIVDTHFCSLCQGWGACIGLWPAGNHCYPLQVPLARPSGLLGTLCEAL